MLTALSSRTACAQKGRGGLPSELLTSALFLREHCVQPALLLLLLLLQHAHSQSLPFPSRSLQWLVLIQPSVSPLNSLVNLAEN